ncbi:MAG: alpha-amylase family glycosyl hydrolase [Flavobacteriales bacterium]
MKSILLASLSIISIIAQAQILTSDPAFPTQDDIITVYYNVATGNAEIPTGTVPVYAHSGIVTQADADNCINNWQYVQGVWGTADPNVVMTPLGGGLHKIVIEPQDFYSYPDAFDPGRLMFVFRNQSGTVVGRNADNSDIWLQLYEPGFHAAIITPYQSIQNIAGGTDVVIHCASSEAADFTLFVNDVQVATASSVAELDYTFNETASGSYQVELEVNNGSETLTDVMVINIDPQPTVENPPAGVEDGINVIDNNTVILQLYAPNKDFVYLLGDFNGWQFSQDYMMKRNVAGDIYWLQLDNLDANTLYRFQYSIDVEDMRVADVYSELILDPWNDPWISETTFPNLPDYPSCQTSQAVSVFKINEENFDWTDGAFVRPPKSRLVIYELLVRDFTEERNYQTLLDTLDYLDHLGITCIELMPINEFEGNDSWGYNPSFYFAPDKAYGTPESLKALVNECHNRGIAVIMDIALNHSFGQNPMVRMYFNPDAGDYGQPTAENPWFNEVPKHDFNVGYDFNHESTRTRNFCKRVVEYWMEEYHIDGYRFDLSKGFTQNNTLGNLGAWAAYDQSRVNILNDYHDHMQSTEPGSYLILEHLADNSEESVLQGDGLMLWGNLANAYDQSSMGYGTDCNLSWGSYQARGWSNPHLVTYAESHDEERMMYKNINFGNNNGGYDINNLNTALDRQELAHTFLIPLPGPKMIWQFGELGYDYSINYCQDGTVDPDCRTYAKPVRWDYRDVAERYKVYKVTAALNHLKKTEALFSTTDYDIDLGGLGKRLHLNSNTLNACIVGNFNVTQINMVPGFQHTGTWYDYFTGNPVDVNDLGSSWSFQPGEYHLYFDQLVETPDTSVNVTEAMQLFGVDLLVYPNPASDVLNVAFHNQSAGMVSVTITDMAGRQIAALANEHKPQGMQLIATDVNALSSGIYLVKITTSLHTYTEQVVLGAR